jgi:hypothetical protein
MELRAGERQPITRSAAAELVRGIAAPTSADGDALAASATAAVRQIARLGGHPLPASVPPARAVLDPSLAPPPGFDWQPVIIFGFLFVPAWLVFEIVTGARRRRDLGVGDPAA